MKLFVAICSLLVASCSAELRDPKSIDPTESRTRQCEEGEGQPQTTPAPDAIAPLARGNFNPINAGAFSAGQAALGLVGRQGRKRRQAGNRFNPELTPFTWFTTNGESITKEECGDRQKSGAAVANRGPILVQRGVYDVCVKFDKAPTWFFTKGGTNAGCDPTLSCCEWFAPYNNPCSPVKGIFWWETNTNTDCQSSFDLIRDVDRNSLFGVEYIVGASVGEKTRVCHVTNPEKFVEGSEPELLQLDVVITYCGEGCCIYEAEDN